MADHLWDLAAMTLLGQQLGALKNATDNKPSRKSSDKCTGSDHVMNAKSTVRCRG